jgi:hypothetical protein
MFQSTHPPGSVQLFGIFIAFKGLVWHLHSTEFGFQMKGGMDEYNFLTKSHIIAASISRKVALFLREHQQLNKMIKFQL